MATQEPTEWLSFSGAAGEKPTAFVQSLNRKAYAEGKSKDDAWVAEYAALCLTDDALEWYYSLGEEIQGSWKKLCPALMKEFSKKPAAAKIAAEIESDIISEPIAQLSALSLATTPAAAPAAAPAPVPALAPAPAPTPAAAAATPPLPPRSPRPYQPPSTARIGYIELFDANTGERLGYICQRDKTITQDINEVLLFELPRAANRTTPVSLRMLNCPFNTPERFYGGLMGLPSPIRWWMMLVCTGPNTESFANGITGVSNVWTVHPIGELLELKLRHPGSLSEPPQRLYAGQYPPMDSLSVQMSDATPKPSSEEMMSAYRKEDAGTLNGFRKMRMIFRQTN